ncbi:Brp/Blh family beta-carotene 15,15'-dioxygenase [Roseivirga sp. BDSF3-8]|uniref:Brp/Blh family beta-carotene 15,15'-dioxygenase n=1 Tax=Roseivirga sp. BDSF3-8 TaxID=3241598 RepID=UPI0035319307
MTRAAIIFIISLVMVLPLLLLFGEPSLSDQLYLCIPFLLLLGIPHGAIDNILFIRNKPISPALFNAVYLVFVGINIALWFIFPAIAYMVFLLISAYHFGQSQFSHYLSQQIAKHKLLYLSWGTLLISSLVLLNYSEVMGIASKHAEFSFLRSLHGYQLMVFMCLISGLGTVCLMGRLWHIKVLSRGAFLRELLLLGVLLGCFYLTPLLIGFTLYFVILHSFKVLREEYVFLKASGEVFSIRQFIKLVAPLTLFSIGGIGLLFGLIYMGWLPISYGYCLLIAISSITLPHVFVMNRFYVRFFRKKNQYKAV